MQDKIRLTLLPHPFETTRKVKWVESDTFENLIEEFIPEKYPLDYIAVYDKDEKIKDFSSKPKSNEVIIKVLPYGGDNSPEENISKGGFWTTVAGFAMVLVGGITGQGWLVYAGVLTIVGGLSTVGVANLTDMFGAMTGQDQSSKVAPSINGGRNQKIQNQPVPILLGTHLVYPFLAAPPYTKVEGNDQYLHQLFLNGYNDIEVDEDSIKIGDNTLDNYTPTPEAVVVTNGATNSIYDKRVRDESIGREVKNDISDEGEPFVSGEIIRTTSTGTNRIEVDISFPQGIVRWNDGEKKALQVTYRLSYSKATDTPDTFILWGEFTQGNSSGDGINETIRFTHNIAPITANQDSAGQYRVKLERVTADRESDSDNSYVDKLYWTNIKSYIGGGTYFRERYIFGVRIPLGYYTPIENPIKSTIRSQLSLLYLKIKASDQLQGAIDTLSFIARLKTKDYNSGTGTWVDDQVTSNPASLFRHVLQSSYVNNKPVPDSEIDWDSLETWHTFCANKGLEFNAYINREITVKELLNAITTVGMASWSMVDNKYTIVIDTYKSDIVQFFTPRNSWNYSGSKSFDFAPTVLKCNFIDETSNWTPEEYSIYYNNVVDDSEENTLDLYGVTNSDQVFTLADYYHKIARLRPEVHSFNADIESLVCTRGDRIKFQHDVPLFGLSSARIKSLLGSGTTITGLELDEIVTFDLGKDYGIIIRTEDGDAITVDITNPATADGHETDVITFVSPISTTTDNVNEDDLIMFGERGVETKDLLVVGIETLDNFEVKLTCVDYNEAIYQEGTNLNDYNPQITIPSGGLNGATDIRRLYNPEQDIVEAASDAKIVEPYKINRAETFVMDIQSDGFITGVTGWHIDITGNAEFNDVTVRGTIEASAGSIANFDINPGSISTGTYNTLNSLYFGELGLSLSDTFRVTSDGELYATAGQISNFTINTDNLSTGAFDTLNTLYFGSSGLSLSDTFKVNSLGEIDATAGTIGGFNISETAFYSQDERIKLDRTENRFEINDIIGNTKVALGYLGNIKDYTNTQYGLYIADGNIVRFEGGGELVDQDYLLKEDGALVIEGDGGVGSEVVRLGSLGGGDVGIDIGGVRFTSTLGGGFATGTFDEVLGGATSVSLVENPLYDTEGNLILDTDNNTILATTDTGWGGTLGGGYADVGDRGLLYSMVDNRLYIYGDALVDGTLTASKLQANTITANEIATGAITAEKISTGAITASKIDTGAITTDKLDANAVTASKIDVDDLFAQNIEFSGNIVSSDFVSGTSGVKLDAVNGVYEFNGDIYAENGVFNGTLESASITGGTINIGGGTFTVSSVGDVVANNIDIAGGTISGNLTATGTITGGTLSGASISGGTINIGSDTFQVSSSGIITYNSSTLSLGSGSSATGVGAISFGNNATSLTQCTAIGINAQALGSESVAIGFGAFTNASGIAIGNGSGSAQAFSTAVGTLSSVGAQFGTALGYDSSADGLQSIAIGRQSVANGSNAIAIGTQASTTTTAEIDVNSNFINLTGFRFAVNTTYASVHASVQTKLSLNTTNRKFTVICSYGNALINTIEYTSNPSQILFKYGTSTVFTTTPANTATVIVSELKFFVVY